MAQAIAQDMDFGNDRFAEEGWSVSYRNKKLSRLITADLYQDLIAKKMVAYWIQKAKLPWQHQSKSIGHSLKPR
jgi:hypothetical protein